VSTRHDHEWGFWSLSLLGELGFLMLFAVARAGWSRSQASTST